MKLLRRLFRREVRVCCTCHARLRRGQAIVDAYRREHFCAFCAPVNLLRSFRVWRSPLSATTRAVVRSRLDAEGFGGHNPI